MERLNLLVEILVGRAALVVVIHDSAQGFQTAIVHVRPGAGDIPKSGRFEDAPVLRIAVTLRRPTSGSGLSVPMPIL